jgi:hypothetical protein
MREEIIKPENPLERRIIQDPLFIAGAMWGKPRRGHPEGAVIYHIGHVLRNIDMYFEGKKRDKLRLIAIIHDTFKYKVDKAQPRHGENHHEMIARRFAEKYISDKEILDIIELHDEAYNSWAKGNRGGGWDKAEQRAERLIARSGDSADMFMSFYRCDNETGDKQTEDYLWFQSLLKRNKR